MTSYISGHDELQVALYGEMPTRTAADTFVCSCGLIRSCGESASDGLEHMRQFHGERPWRPEPVYYVSPHEEVREEKPDFVVLVDRVCAKHGGKNLIIQYDNETQLTIIDNCEGCAREG